jgi:pyruvate/2-oxoglutarate dehydrogenase complex dihydrolipoamide acyltransferase (E2) component
LWFFVRRNPYWFKDLAGTVGVTSVGMYTKGAAIGVPITPMTITLSVGTMDKKLMLQDGQPVERDIVHLNLSFDHGVIDGAPVMRFAERFKQIMLNREALKPPAA